MTFLGEILAPLEDFKKSSANYIIIGNYDSQKRGLIHEWARGNGFESKSEYFRDSKRIVRVCCGHCDKWNKLDEVKNGNDFFEDHDLAWSLGLSVPDLGGFSIPDDNYITCPHCQEKTYFDDDNGANRIRWKSLPRATGQMLIMKTKEPGYKLKTKGWWRPRRENL